MILMPINQWAQFKSVVVTTKAIALQYVEYGNRYEIFAQENGVFVWTIVLLKDGGAATLDFENNFKSQANAAINGFKILGASTLTHIGNVNDQLKVRDNDAIAVLNNINTALGGAGSINIFRRNEVSVTSRNETDLPTASYTVPAGKKFSLTSIAASYDFSASMYVRLKKQVGGMGPFTTEMRITMMAGGQGEATDSIQIPSGVIIANAGDVVKLTYESSIAKGTLWAEFSGSEV